MLQLAVILLAIGTVALLLELLIPGFDGFACGIVGIIALVLSAIITVIWHDYGWFFVGAGVAVLGLLVGFVYNFVTKRQLQGRFFLNDNLAEDTSIVGDLSSWVGKEGTAISILKPYGEADFNGVHMEVASTGAFIERGARIKVVETQGRKVVVSEVGGN